MTLYHNKILRMMMTKMIPSMMIRYGGLRQSYELSLGAENVPNHGSRSLNLHWLRSQDILDRSTALKVQGNAEFGHGQWELAMASYREGLAELPVRTRPAASTEANGKAKASDASQESTEVEATLENLSINEDNDGTPEDNSEMKEVSELRSILFANVAACCLKLVRPWSSSSTL